MEGAIAFLGVRGRVFDINSIPTTPTFSDCTRSAIFVKTAIGSALQCPICMGLLDPAKSVSYDHKTPKSQGGTGQLDNGQIVHPYCNSAKAILLT